MERHTQGPRANRILKNGMVLYEKTNPRIISDAERGDVVFVYTPSDKIYREEEEESALPALVTLNGLGMGTKAQQDFESKVIVLGVIGPNGVLDKCKK